MNRHQAFIPLTAFVGPVCRLALLLFLCLSLGAATAAENESAPLQRAIFMMHPDGTEVRRVVFIESYPLLGGPRFSHAGRRLAFHARGNRPARTLVIDTDGRNLLDLGAGTWPDWSPDDKQIMFEVPGAGRASIWVQNADGKGSSWLANGTLPRWSPDGSQIAVSTPPRILDVVTGEERPLFEASDHVSSVVSYDWSPDGKQLAVVIERDDKRELVLLDVAGAEPRLAVRLQAEVDGAPSWSPDGGQLAVAIHDPARAWCRLHLLAASGDDPPRLIAGQAGDNVDPAFSPDGQWLVFASTRRAD